MKYIILAILFIFFITGCFGNLATFVTFKCEKGLRPFTKIMLGMVTFWDSNMLIFHGIYWYFLINGNLSLVKMNFYMLELVFYYLQINGYCTIWHLSVTGLEKMCLVLWPTNSLIRHASIKEAIIISTCFILFSAFLSYFPIITFKFDYVIAGILLFLFASAIPFIILFTSSFIVFKKLNKSSNTINPKAQNQVSVSTLLSIKMVIVVSVYYFLTYTPLNIFYFITLYFPDKNRIFKSYFESIYNIMVVISISNNSIKFYLYTIFVPHLKKEFLNICKKLIYKIKETFSFSNARCWKYQNDYIIENNITFCFI